MSINAVVKKPIIKPGLKTASKSLSTVPTFSSSTGTVGVAKTTSTSTSAASNVVKQNMLLGLQGQTTTSSVFRNPEYTKYNNFVGGMRNVNPNDYTMYNVDAAIGKYSSTPFAPTSRSLQREQARMADMYAQMQRAYAPQNNASNAMSTMAMLNQLGTLAGDVTKAIVSTKASKSQAASQTVAQQTAPEVKLGSEVGNAISDLSKADSSKEIQSGLSTVDNQITSKTKISDSLSEAITNDGNAKTEAETKLGEIKTGINSTKASIRGIDAQLPRLEAQLATLTASGQDASAVQAQIDQLKQQKTELETKLADLEKQESDKETEIANLETSIKENTAEKQKVDGELATLEKTKSEYESKQARFEKSEQRESQSSQSKLTKLAEKLGKETDETKKQQLIEDYKKLASSYNKTVDNTTVTGFQKVAEEPVLPSSADLQLA